MKNNKKILYTTTLIRLIYIIIYLDNERVDLLTMQSFKKFNLLLVEDDFDIRESFVQTLGYYFNDVFEAEDGEKALDLYEKENINVIFCDYMMPNMNGVEFIKNIRKKDKTLPIAMISNYSDQEMLLKCIPLNLMGYILKPLRYDDLKNFLENTVALHLKELEKLFYFEENCFYDLSSSRLYVGSSSFQLSRLEKDLIELLLEYNGKSLSIEIIEEHLYPDQFYTGTKVKNLIYRIRKKYSFPYIENIRDIGYSLKFYEK